MYFINGLLAAMDEHVCFGLRDPSSARLDIGRGWSTSIIEAVREIKLTILHVIRIIVIADCPWIKGYRALPGHGGQTLDRQRQTMLEWQAPNLGWVRAVAYRTR